MPDRTKKSFDDLRDVSPQDAHEQVVRVLDEAAVHGCVATLERGDDVLEQRRPAALGIDLLAGLDDRTEPRHVAVDRLLDGVEPEDDLVVLALELDALG